MVAHTLPSLLSGKIHTILCRKWGSRVKGRDWYDLLWLLGLQIPVNLKFLENKLKQTNYLQEKNNLSLDMLKELLIAKANNTDFNKALDDILPFLEHEVNPDLLFENGYVKGAINNIKASQA